MEYSWGFSKSVYRRHPLAAKKGRDNFIALVDKCISSELITKTMVRKFSGRARGYMIAYRMLESEEMNEHDESTDITHQMIEKMKMVVSSHRASLDFDKSYLNKVVTAEGYDFVAEVKSEKVGLVRREDRRGGTRRKRQTLLDISEIVKKQKSSATS